MATITLRKSKFDGIQGVLDKLKASFKNYEASLNELKRTAEGVDSDACNLADTINDIASSSESEKEKVKKIQNLNKKIETFVNTAINRERAARDEIVKKKNDFYKKYKNLKPECEKSTAEKVCEKIGKWVEENIDKIIAAIIILAAIVICIFFPAAIAIVGAIACALSAAMGIADMICMACNGGKDIATVLAENGHGFWAKVWSGTSFGLDIASIILPIGAGIKAMGATTKMTFKASLKGFAKHPLKTIGSGAKRLGSSIKSGALNKLTKLKTCVINFKTNPLKSIGSGLKGLGKKFLDITGVSDIGRLKDLGKIGKGANYAKVLNDKNFNSFSKYSDAVDVDKAIKNLPDSSKNLNNKMRNNLQNEFIDNTIDKIAKDDKFAKDFQKMTGIDTTLKGKRDPTKMTKTQFKDELSRLGYTLHEDFDTFMVQIVPTNINKNILHNGGTARALGLAGKGEIYDSANYRPNEFAQKAIKKFKDVSGVKTVIDNYINNGIKDNFINTVFPN